jgi:hypothetical protein
VDTTDASDEKFIPFIEVFQNYLLTSERPVAKYIDSDDGDTASF